MLADTPSPLPRSGSLAEAAKERALATIDRNTRAQAQIVDDLLDVSSIVLGTLKLERRPLNLLALVASEVELVRPEESAGDVTLACQADAQPSCSATRRGCGRSCAIS